MNTYAGHQISIDQGPPRPRSRRKAFHRAPGGDWHPYPVKSAEMMVVYGAEFVREVPNAR